MVQLVEQKRWVSNCTTITGHDATHHDSVGADVGVLVGTGVGTAVGADVGEVLGTTVGMGVGTAVGVAVGVAVGAADGTIVGQAVGADVGAAQVDAVHAPLSQSLFSLQVLPVPQPGQPPPQSRSVSRLFCTPSLQFADVGLSVGAAVGNAVGVSVG